MAIIIKYEEVTITPTLDELLDPFLFFYNYRSLMEQIMHDWGLDFEMLCKYVINHIRIVANEIIERVYYQRIPLQDNEAHYWLNLYNIEVSYD